MARRRFFVDAIRGGRAELTDDDAQHLTRVLRVEAGERYEISDNERVYLAEVETARKSQVVFRVVETLPAEPEGISITLIAALIKFDHFEWMLEKATELGVSTIVPIETDRSDYGLEKAAQKRHVRWERIVLESSQQSRRTRLPMVERPTTFSQVLARPADLRVFLDEEPGAPPLLQVLPGSRNATDHVAVMLGPEGGWTDRERTSTAEAGWKPVSLGRQILRAETAAIAALAIVQQGWL